jgi:hypothetical protein
VHLRSRLPEPTIRFKNIGVHPTYRGHQNKHFVCVISSQRVNPNLLNFNLEFILASTHSQRGRIMLTLKQIKRNLESIQRFNYFPWEVFSVSWFKFALLSQAALSLSILFLLLWKSIVAIVDVWLLCVVGGEHYPLIYGGCSKIAFSGSANSGQ